MVLSKQNCDTYRTDKTPLPASQLCAISPEGKLLTNGDNGGALEIENGDSKTSTIIGIFSYVAPAKTRNRALIYTRITFYVDWIKAITKI